MLQKPFLRDLVVFTYLFLPTHISNNYFCVLLYWLARMLHDEPWNLLSPQLYFQHTGWHTALSRHRGLHIIIICSYDHLTDRKVSSVKKMTLSYQCLQSLNIADVNRFLTNKINYKNGHLLFLTWNRKCVWKTK